MLHVPNIPLVVVDDKVRGNSAPDGEQTGTGLFPVTTYSSAGGVACSTPGSQFISRVRLLASYALQCEANEVGRPVHGDSSYETSPRSSVQIPSAGSAKARAT